MRDLLRRGGKYWQLPALCTAFVSLSFFSPRFPAPTPSSPKITSTVSSRSVRSYSLADTARFNVFYDSLDLEHLGLSPEAYRKAISGFLNLVITGQIPNPDLLSIIDFSLPSSQKRLFIIDMLNGKLLFNSLVAHGRNSGKLIANRFSNKYNSFMSSIGFYLTGDPFVGHHGYSLRLEGLEKGWNDNIHGRSIIMHPAPYVSEDHVRQWGFLGRSEGCPAIPAELDRPIIESIRGGSCMFVYAPNEVYMKRSKIMNPPVAGS